MSGKCHSPRRPRLPWEKANSAPAASTRAARQRETRGIVERQRKSARLRNLNERSRKLASRALAPACNTGNQDLVISQTGIRAIVSKFHSHRAPPCARRNRLPGKSERAAQSFRIRKEPATVGTSGNPGSGFFALEAWTNPPVIATLSPAGKPGIVAVVIRSGSNPHEAVHRHRKGTKKVIAQPKRKREPVRAAASRR